MRRVTRRTMSDCMAARKWKRDHDEAYRTYVIRVSPTRTWIEKGGAFIGYATDRENARQIIDGLLD